MSLATQLLLVPVLIAANAFFVCAEYVVVAARPQTLAAMRTRRRGRSADALAALQARPGSSIGAIQVCITMTNLLLGWIGEPAMTAVLVALFAPLADVIPPAGFTVVSTVLAFVVVTFLTVVFSELLPKALTLRHTRWLAGVTALPALGILAVMKPLVVAMNAVANAVTRPLGLGRVDTVARTVVTAEEIRRITTEATGDGSLSASERSLILNALAMGVRTAKQIMVPRVRVAYLDVRRDMEENRRVMGEYLYSRLPLCDGGLDRVIGILHTKEFLTAHSAQGDISVLRLIARPAVFAPETIRVDQLLGLIHERQSETVLLVDEHGGVEGLVTLADVVDELVGAAGNATVSDRGADQVVGGDLPVHELAGLLARPEWGANESVVTVGGLLALRLGRVPVVGEQVEIEGVRLRVLESDGRIVLRVRVTPPAPLPSE